MKTIDTIRLSELEYQKKQALMEVAKGDFRNEELNRINEEINQLENQ